MDDTHRYKQILATNLREAQLGFAWNWSQKNIDTSSGYLQRFWDLFPNK